MPFTIFDARGMVGGSRDWAVGLEASIKKWEQICGGDVESYEGDADCGFCMVADNRCELCKYCPATSICSMDCTRTDAETVLRMLREIDLGKEV